MQFAILLLALAGAAIATDGAHGNILTLTESTTVTVYTCTGAVASACTQEPHTIPVPGSMVPPETPALPTASSSSGHVETPNTTKVEVPPTVVVTTPVATTQTPTYTTTNVTVTGNATATESNTVSYVTSVTVVTPSGTSGRGASSTPTSPSQVGAGVRAVIPNVMLGLLALGASILA